MRNQTPVSPFVRLSSWLSRRLESAAIAAEPAWVLLWLTGATGSGLVVAFAPTDTKVESVATNVFASVLIAPLIIFFVQWGIDRRVREREAARIHPRRARIRSAVRAEVSFILNRIFVVNPSLLGTLEVPWLEDGDVTEFLASQWHTRAAAVEAGLKSAGWNLLNEVVAGIEDEHRRLVDLTFLGLESLPPEAHARLMDAVDAIRTAIDRQRAGTFVVARRQGDDRKAMEKVFANHVANELVRLVDALVGTNLSIEQGLEGAIAP